MFINYIDPALIHIAGHHFQWCKKIVFELAKTPSFNIRIYCNKSPSLDIFQTLSKNADVIPAFSYHPYIGYDNKFDDSDDANSKILYSFLESSNSMAFELNGVQNADIWIIPTLFGYQLTSLAKVKPNARIFGCIQNPPNFMYDSLGSSIWKYGARKIIEANLNIRITTTVIELQSIYQELLRMSIPTLPIFYDSIPIAKAKNSLRRIGFFGHQSPHKGIFLLQQLVTHLIELGYEVVVQDSGGSVTASQTSNLKILPYVDNLANEMVNCDLIVCPYDPQFYRYSASGIVWEAVSHGVPVIGPLGTPIGRFINETGAGINFDSFNVSSILNAIEIAKINYSKISLAAFNSSKNWSDVHGSNHFIKEILY